MLARTTQSDTGSLVWSPQRDKMAYATSKGLQVYLSDPNSDEERYVTLSTQAFGDLSWSDDGRYLAGRNDQGVWHIYRFDGMRVHNVYRVFASTLDWLGNDQIVYVPDAGGLMLVDLRDTLNEIRLAG